MPFPIVVIALLVLLGLSGGFQGSFASTSTASSSAERSTFSRTSNSETQSVAGARSQRFDTSFALPGEAGAGAIDYRLPSATTVAARNIETQSVVLRGSAMLRTYKDGVVFFVYGYNQERVAALATTYRSSVTPPPIDDRAQVVIVDRRANGSEAYERRVSNLAKDTKYYYVLCVEYQTVAGTKATACGNQKSVVTNPAFSVTNSNFNTPRISLRSPLNITDSEVSFTGQVRMNDGVDGVPFLVYGESESLVRAVEQNRSYSGVKEDDDDLQKVRIAAGLRGQYDFTIPLAGLDNNQTYYYRACVEYDGERDGLVCDSVRMFTTDSRDKSNKPTAVTGKVSVAGTRATLTGSADMEDFLDGVAFFVYGTDEIRIAAIESQGSFNRINQSIDRLQRISVDDDLDGKNTFSRTIQDLLPGTTYTYRMCVQYTDEDDRGREQFFLRCGTPAHFTTGT